MDKCTLGPHFGTFLVFRGGEKEAVASVGAGEEDVSADFLFGAGEPVGELPRAAREPCLEAGPGESVNAVLEPWRDTEGDRGGDPPAPPKAVCVFFRVSTGLPRLLAVPIRDSAGLAKGLLTAVLAAVPWRRGQSFSMCDCRA
jgi:hypothetical protein